MTLRLLVFLGVAAAGGLAVILTAGQLGGDTARAAAVLAFVLCLVPAVATLLLSEAALKWSPQAQISAILGGTGIRMFLVATVALVLALRVDWIYNATTTDGVTKADANGGYFWYWVLLFYGLTLALEVTMILWAHRVTRPTTAAHVEVPAAAGK